MRAKGRIWPRMRSTRALENGGFMDIVALWALRYVVHVRAQRCPHNFGWTPALGPILTHVGIDADFDDQFVHPANVIQQVRRRLEQMEHHPHAPSGTLVRNVGLMAEILDLDAAGLLDRLESECRTKRPGGREKAIGFGP